MFSWKSATNTEGRIEGVLVHRVVEVVDVDIGELTKGVIDVDFREIYGQVHWAKGYDPFVMCICSNRFLGRRHITKIDIAWKEDKDS